MIIETIMQGLVAASLAQPDNLIVRDGYEVTVAVDNMPHARFMAFDDTGLLYVARSRAGDILTAKDLDGDGVYDGTVQFVQDADNVCGIQWHDGWMWFAPGRSVERARDTDGDGQADEREIILDHLPTGGNHWWRALLVTDEGFYHGIGDSGNIEDERETDRQKIWFHPHGGGERQLFVSGVRNTEKLRLRPGTTEVWGFDHGSDWYGAKIGDQPGAQPFTDHQPADELNRYEAGRFYGHPFIVGNMVPRLEYLEHEELQALAQRTTPPEWEVGAHWACNGWAFIDPELNQGVFSEDHEGDILVAAHGSWNSAKKVGYCIARVMFDEGEPYGLLKIVETLGEQQQVYARPVDVVQAPDGSILFSSDHPVGRIYRIRPSGD